MSNQIKVFVPYMIRWKAWCSWIHMWMTSYWEFNRIVEKNMGTYTSSPLFIPVKIKSRNIYMKQSLLAMIHPFLSQKATMTTLLKIRNWKIEHSPLCTLYKVARDNGIGCHFSQQLGFEAILCLKVCRGIICMTPIIDAVLFFLSHFLPRGTLVNVDGMKC